MVDFLLFPLELSWLNLFVFLRDNLFADVHFREKPIVSLCSYSFSIVCDISKFSYELSSNAYFK